MERIEFLDFLRFSGLKDQTHTLASKYTLTVPDTRTPRPVPLGGVRSGGQGCGSQARLSQSAVFPLVTGPTLTQAATQPSRKQLSKEENRKEYVDKKVLFIKCQ